MKAKLGLVTIGQAPRVDIVPVLALLVAGCVSLTPAQQQGTAAVRAFATRAAELYEIWKPGFVFGPTAGEGARYRQGTLYVSSKELTAPNLPALIAHEMGHYVLGHDTPLRAADPAGQEAEQYAREIDAHVKAVEILARVQDTSEIQALRQMHAYLISVYRNQQRPGVVVSRGHRGGCIESQAMLARFPQYRLRLARLECAPPEWIAARPPLEIVALAPSREGSLSDRVLYAYFTDEPPAPGSTVRTTIDSNLPRRRTEFYEDRDSSFVLFVMLKREGESFHVVSRWYDGQGRERKVIERTMTHTGTRSPYGWQTHVVPAYEMAPGPWKVTLTIDGTAAGEYAFSLRGE